MKQCSRCKETKKDTDFHWKRPGVLRSQCKACANNGTLAWYHRLKGGRYETLKRKRNKWKRVSRKKK